MRVEPAVKLTPQHRALARQQRRGPIKGGGEPLAQAKVAVLVASTVAGILGLVLGLVSLPPMETGEVRMTPHDAERSTLV